MEYISSDTNVWLDFMMIEQLELPFRLPYARLTRRYMEIPYSLHVRIISFVMAVLLIPNSLFASGTGKRVRTGGESGRAPGEQGHFDLCNGD